MSDFRKYLDEQLNDEEFRKEWDASECEYSLAKSLVKARKESHMTQKELAEKTGINQADISKIETGNANPALSTLQRLAEGMGMRRSGCGGDLFGMLPDTAYWPGNHEPALEGGGTYDHRGIDCGTSLMYRLWYISDVPPKMGDNLWNTVK